MLKRAFADGIDRMGKVAKPETLERAPRYEYDPGNISGTQKIDQGISQSQSCMIPCA